MADKKKKKEKDVFTTGNLITQDRNGNVVKKKATPINLTEHFYRRNETPGRVERIQTGKNKTHDIKSNVSRTVLRRTTDDGYTDTKRKFGDYNKKDKQKADYKIYQKDNKYYYYDEKNKKYEKMVGKFTTTKNVIDNNTFKSQQPSLLSSDAKKDISKPTQKKVTTTRSVDYSKQIAKDIAKDDAEQKQRWLKSLSKEDRKAYEESEKYANQVQEEKYKKAQRELQSKTNRLRAQKVQEGLDKLKNRDVPTFLEAVNYVEESNKKEKERKKELEDEYYFAPKITSYNTKMADLNPVSPHYGWADVDKMTEQERINYAKEENEYARTLFEKNQWEQMNTETTGLEKALRPVASAATQTVEGLDVGGWFGHRRYIDETGRTNILPSANELAWERTLNSYNSKAARFAAEATNNATKLLMSEALNMAIPYSGTAVYWTSMFGNSYQRALNMTGGDSGKAIINAIANTGLEFLTGKFLGSATKGVTGGQASQLETALSNATYKLSKNKLFSSYVGKMGSEGTEEFLQEYLGNAVDVITMGTDGTHESLEDIISDPDVLSAALYSGAIGAMTSLGVSGAGNVMTRASGGYTEAQSIQMMETYKESLSETIEEYKKNPKKNKTKIEKLEKVLKEVEKQSQNPFTDNTVKSSMETAEMINNEVRSTYTKKQKSEIDKIQQMVLNGELDEETGLGYIRQVENGTYSKHRNLEKVAEQKISELKNQLQQGLITGTEYNEGLNAVNATMNSERNRIEGIEEQTPQTSLKESAARNNLDPESDTVKVVQNAMDKRGIKASFDANRFSDTNTNAFWSIDEDRNREVVFNPNATTDDIIEEIAIHEITHDLMSSSNSKEALQGDNILKFVKSMKGYEEARSRIEQTYSDTYDINDPKYEQLIDEEVIADVLGRKLGNQEFINQLVNKKQNWAKRIYDFVVEKLNSLVNSGDKVRSERLYWENIKNNFEKAYNMEYNNDTNEEEIKKSKSNDIANQLFSDDMSIDDYINKDKRKRKFKNYSSSKSYFKLDYDVMDEINAIVAAKAHKAVNGNNISFTQTIEADGKTYTIYADILSDDNYNITHTEIVKDISKEVAHETKINRNIKYSLADTTNERGKSNIDNQSNRYTRRSKRISEVSKNQLQQIDNPRTNKEITRNNKKELDNSSFSKDNQGRKLTEQQVKYFKDSKVRDKNGNLKVMYHGTQNDFNVFDMKKFGGKNGTAEGFGIYLSDNLKVADDYGGRIIESYVNVTNPASSEKLTVNQNNLIKCIEDLAKKDAKEMVSNGDYKTVKEALKDTWISNYTYTYDQPIELSYRDVARNIINSSESDSEVIQELMNGSGNNDYKTVDSFYDTITEKLGFDGIQTQWDFKDDDLKKKNANILIAFRSNQVKNVNNTNPTTDDDIRKSQSNDEWKRFLDKNIKRSGTGRTLNDIRTGPNQLSQVETTGEQGAKYWQSQGVNTEVAKILSEKPKDSTKTLLQKIKDGKAALGEEIKFFKRKFVDKGETIRTIGKKKRNPKLYAKFDKMGTARAEANYKIGNAQTNNEGIAYKNFTDKSGKKITLSLNGIWDMVEGFEDEANEYLAHWLNVDRYGQVNENGRKLKEQLDAQVKAGKITQQEANEVWDNSGEIYKYVFGPSVTAEDSIEEIKKLEKAHPELKLFGQNIWQYGENELQNRVDAGVVSQEEASSFKANTPHYVRLQRNVESKSNPSLKIDNKGNAKINKNIQEFKGSTLDILPFKDSMAQYTLETTEGIRKNLFCQELAKTLGVSSTFSPVDSIDEMYGVNPELIKDNGDGTYSLTFFNRGQAVEIPINEGIYEALQPNEHYDIEDKLPFRVIRKFDNFRKALLTDKNPMFMVTNMLKDAFDAPLNSKYPSLFAKNYVRALKEITTNGKYYQQYLALGGLQNSYFEKGEFQKQRGKLNPIGWIEKGNNTIEQLPRLAEFISTMEKTGDVDQAMYNAAEITTNFKRGGDWTKILNRNGATFLNASVQGFSKQIRNFSDIQNPVQAVQFLGKILVLGIAPALINDAMYDDDDEYKEIQDYQKDRYYLFKGKNGDWIRIPKGRAVSIFQSAARRTKYYIKGDKDAFKGLGKLVGTQVAPNNPFENNTISPIVDVARNKSWSGNEIVSKYMEENTKAEDQYDAKTDELSKWLGKKLKKSPKKINYLIDQYSGAIGDVVLPNITKYKTHEVNGPADVILNPFRDKFTTNIANSNKSQEEFYNAIGEVKKEHTTKGELQSKYLGSKSKEITELRTKISNIQSSNKSAKEKIEKTREYQNEINKIAKEAVKNYQKVDINKYSATVGENTYYKTKSGTWYKESDKAAQKRSWENMDAEEYYKNKVETQKVSTDNIENTVRALNFKDYEKYTYKISKIKGDKDARGKTIYGSRQKKVVDYVNSLDISELQKATLLKKTYKSFRSYDNQISNTINKSNLSKKEKEEMYSYLGLGR